MPLNRDHGEVLDGGPASLHVVIEPRALANLSNVLVPYVEKKKFRKVQKVRPVFDDAVAHAIEAFKKIGALYPVRFDEDCVLVQVYPKDLKVSVTFQRLIAAQEHYVTRVYDLPKVVIEALLATAPRPARTH